MPAPDRKDKLIRDFNHLLATGSIITAIPVDEKLCSFLYASLTGITGVVQCRICLYTESEPYGLKCDYHCSRCNFFKTGGNCLNRTSGKDILFRLTTLRANYAFISVVINDNFFEELIPAIQNLGNITAITIENNIHNGALRKNNLELKNNEEELTRKVNESTLELHRSNKELHKTVEILNEAQSIVNIGHWELDLNTSHLYWSDEVYRIFGLSRNNFLPTFDSFLDRVFQDDRELVEKTFSESIREKKSYYIEHRILCSDKIKYVQEQGKIYYDEQENAVKAIGMVLDISERKHTEKIIEDHRIELEQRNKVYEKINEALVEKNKEYEILVKQLRDANIKIKLINEELITSTEKARESDRLKTAFLNNMSHEIRTPMNAIIGFSQLLPYNLTDKDKIESFVKIIIQRGNDLLRIVDDILDVSKIESGLIPVIHETFSLKSFFDELKLDFSEEKMRFGKVHLPFDTFVDASLTKAYIATDKLKLRQIFYNLTSNSFKFTENGKIEAGCKLSDQYGILFYVSDTGPGIVPEKQEIVFNPFTQLEPNSSMIYGGTGLGLSIVKGFVKLLGGNIWVESDPGKGCVFYFYIDHSRVMPGVLNCAEDKKQHQVKFEEKKVLIVEDDEFNRILINEILLTTGVKLVFAVTGSEAIDSSLKENPDLILIDISLPDMQGYEVIKTILRYNPASRIIAHTAYTGDYDRRKALSAGCVEHLGKPIKPQDLIDAVKRNLD